MRVAVISDVHANLEALEAVLEQVDGEGVDQLWFAGDLVGFGPDPNAVCELLGGQEFIGVVGDHDYAVVKEDYTGSGRMEKQSLEWTRKELGERNLNFLSWFQSYHGDSIHGQNVLMVHGNPDNLLTGHVYRDDPEEELERYLEDADADVLVSGHTHLPFTKKLGEKALVNAGSVGFPLDGDNRASYAVLDIGKETEVEIKRVDYDVDTVVEKARKAEIPEDIALRLENAEI